MTAGSSSHALGPATNSRARDASGHAAETPLRTPWLALAALTLLAIALRSVGLDGGLWLDEILTLVDSVRHPLAQIVTVFPGNNQHTLYSVLAHVSIRALGEVPWTLRLPALIFGAATPAMLYFFAREFTGRGEALLAGLLVAVSYHHVWFSQNARGYTALAFFVLLSSWLLLRGLRRGRKIDFAAYGVASALGVYTHLTMVFVVLAHAAVCAVRLGLPWGMGRARWRLPLLGFALSALVSLALYAPLLFDVQQFFLKRTLPPPVATPAWAAKALASGLTIGMGTALGAIAAAVLLGWGLWSYYRQSAWLAALFVLPGAFTLAAVLALRQPIFPRFLFLLVGFGVLVIVRGALEIGALPRRSRDREGALVRLTPLGIALVAAIALASAAALPHDYRYPKQDFDGALRFVQGRRSAGEPVAVAGGAIFPYQKYYGEPWPGVDSLDELRRIRAQGRRVWVVYTLPEYIAAGAPDLMRALRDGCVVEGVFRGTVAGGDVTVCALSALERDGQARPPGGTPR